MKVNGTVIALKESQSLLDYLELNNYNIKIIAVEHNSEIITRSTYKDIMLKDDDTLEIINFVGGG